MKPITKLNVVMFTVDIIMVIVIIMMFLAIPGCDSTNAEMIDGQPNLTLKATVQVIGVREVGSELLFVAHMPVSHNYNFKFAPDFTNDPGNLIYSQSGALDYTYDKPGFYLVVVYGQDKDGHWLKSEATGITINKK